MSVSGVGSPMDIATVLLSNALELIVGAGPAATEMA
jgi:hypothetical protein